MRTILMPRALGSALCVMLLTSRAATPPKLPAELPINHGAGRGGLLIVPVRIEGGEELPFVLDTGSTGTLVDKSLEPKLGKRLGTSSIAGDMRIRLRITTRSSVPKPGNPALAHLPRHVSPSVPTR